MPHGQRVIGRERKLVCVGGRALDIVAVNRIRTIEHKDWQLRFARFFHHVTQCRDVGIKAHADVLNVINQGVEVFHLFGFRAARFAVKGKDRQACLFVSGV